MTYSGKKYFGLHYVSEAEGEPIYLIASCVTSGELVGHVRITGAAVLYTFHLFTYIVCLPGVSDLRTTHTFS